MGRNRTICTEILVKTGMIFGSLLLFIIYLFLEKTLPDFVLESRNVQHDAAFGTLNSEGRAHVMLLQVAGSQLTSHNCQIARCLSFVLLILLYGRGRTVLSPLQELIAPSPFSNLPTPIKAMLPCVALGFLSFLRYPNMVLVVCL
jgi:hypothetical protein